MKVKFYLMTSDFHIKTKIVDIRETAIFVKDKLWYPMYKKIGMFNKWEHFPVEATQYAIDSGQSDGIGYPKFCMSYNDAIEFIDNKFKNDTIFPLPKTINIAYENI